MIVEIHRGHVKIELEGKMVAVYGEAYLPGHGSPDFIAYRSSILYWEGPEKQPLNSEEMIAVERALHADFKAMGMSIEIE